MLDMVATRAEIAAHRPFDPVEAYNQQSFLRLIDESPTPPITRKHFSPGHITVSTWVLAKDTQRVLLFHHIKTGRWFQPGGHIEPQDDSLLATAMREVAEECGFVPDLALPPHMYDLDVHGITAHKDEPDHLHFDVRFLFLLKTEQSLGNSEAAAEWLTLDQARERMGYNVYCNRLFAKTKPLF